MEQRGHGIRKGQSRTKWNKKKRKGEGNESGTEMGQNRTKWNKVEQERRDRTR